MDYSLRFVLILLLTISSGNILLAHNSSNSDKVSSMSNDGHISMETMNATQKLVKKELEMVRIDEKVGDVINSELNFYNKHKELVSLKDYIGESDKPLVLSFAYYSCSLICQFVLQGQVDVFNKMDLKLGRDYNALTISFDDDDDAELTSKMVETYAEKIHDQVQGEFDWEFLYGNSEEIKEITEQVGFYFDYIEANGEFAHSAAIYVITPEGKISRYFYGVQFDAFDLKLALIEAKSEKTRTTSEKILLFCYQYDSESRGYALEARRIMKAGGLVTVLLLGIFFVFANNKRIRIIGKKE